jgi:hypothetical protein
MRPTFRVLLGAMALLLTASASLAHHSVTGQFDPTRSVTLTGVIVKVDWINPHVYLFLDVTAQDGTVETWSLASAPTAMMRRAGLTKESVQGAPGEVVTIQGIPARDETKRLAWIYTITYADGRSVRLSQDRK